MLEETWTREEQYWRQQSRVQWLRAGDRNTKVFHQTTVESRRKNAIRRLQISYGTWTENDEDVMRDCEEYFRGIFQTEGCNGVNEQLTCVSEIVNDQMNEILTRRVERKEVLSAVFQLGGNKASGPDGFSSIFYHCFWDVLGDYVFYSIKKLILNKHITSRLLLY